MGTLEKLIQARNLIIEAEADLIEEKGFCPYEIGFALRKLNEAINQFKSEQD